MSTAVMILTLALAASSEWTFNTVFKKHMSLTPSNCRQVAGA